MDCRGFSLIEVLVAFTILALLLGVLFQIFAGGLRAAYRGDEYTRAVLLAESKLAALGIEEKLTEGIESGSFDDVYQWQTTVEPYPWEEETTGQRKLPVQPFVTRVEVYWGDGTRRQSVSLVSLGLAVPP